QGGQEGEGLGQAEDRDDRGRIARGRPTDRGSERRGPSRPVGGGAGKPGDRHLRFARAHGRRAGPPGAPQGARRRSGRSMMGGPGGPPPDLANAEIVDYTTIEGDGKVRLKLKDGSIVEIRLEIMNILRA